jgi:class 3 adenylate cyclase/tetratricopeptide (TPR) repeat protein
MTTRAQTVTILFTDLVGSTELLQRAGDEQAQRIFKAHHRLLREAVEAHGGHEVKWLGDGLMVAFDSTADAVKCAIAMQQASRRPTAGERLEIRAGLNVGEAFVDESDYFGTSVVIARRLCDSGGAGQIRASDIVVRLLDGRGDGIQTKDLGALDLKGITNPVPAVEIIYDHDPLALLRRLPFVGRDAEYETMLKKLAEARNSRGSVILLAGEPGIGKTRLTEEFCQAASPDAAVIRGNCYEGDVAAPFGPWTEALRSLLEQTPDADLRDTLGPGAPDIAAMLPEVRRRIPDLEEAPRLEPEAERARLFDSINAWLKNAAERKPLVIFFDDLHWCDRPSLALLEQVARNIANQRIVIVGTYRDVEVDRVHPLAQTLAALRRMEHHERIALKGFSVESVLGLLNAIEPDEATEPARRALAQALHDECEGNPFFIREVLNNLVETGKLAQRDGVWVGTVASIEELGIPEGIKEVIGRRLTRLSETCNRMLGRASAMTGGFTWDELRAICDDAEDDLLDALDEALGSQLIEERERNSYAFTHALIRATLYDELSTPRRVQLHRRIAESLESLYAESIDDHLGELAAHYMASTGNAAEKAVEYSIRAGDRAREQYAWEDAAAHYERALQAMELTSVQDEQTRVRVLLDLGGCQYRAGMYDLSIASLRLAIGAARSMRSAELFARGVLLFEDLAYRVVDDDLATERLALLDEALQLLGPEVSVQRVQLMCSRVRAAASAAHSRAGGSNAPGMLASAGDRDELLLEQARDALTLAERLGDGDTMWLATVVLLDYGWTPDNLQECLELIARAYQAAPSGGGGRRGHVARRAIATLELGDTEAFRALAAEYAELLARYRYLPDEWIPEAMLATLELAAGHLAAAEERRERYTSLPGAGGEVVATSVAQLAFLRQLQGRMPEIETMWRPLVERFPLIPAFAGAHAVMHAHAGRTAEAIRIIERLVVDDVRPIPRDFFWKGTVYLLADACAEVDHLPAAAALHDSLLPYVSANATVGLNVTYGSVARVVGRLAAMLERYDEAEQHFETALASNEQQGLHAWTAWTRLNYGEMLLRRNRPADRDRAITLLRQAHDFAKESGMGKVERDSERLLASLA